MARGTVTFRCGARATVTYQDGRPEQLRQRRREAALRSCPACEGRGALGWEWSLGKGGLELWSWREVSPTEDH